MKTFTRTALGLAAGIMLGLAVVMPTSAEFVPAEQHPRFIAKVRTHAATVQGAVMTKAAKAQEIAAALAPGE